MKKSILLLTASALLSIGALTGCKQEQPSSEAPASSSEVVDPEADWPVHEWSAEEKQMAATALGVDAMSSLPFYYVKDQQVTDAYVARSFVMSVVAPAATAEDVANYELKLLASGFDPVAGFGSGRYRKALSSSYRANQYLDVHVYLGDDGDWNIDFLVGTALNDHSFAGRDSESSTLAGQLNDVSEAIEDFFKKSGVGEVVLPKSITGANNFNRVDFIDYGPSVYQYYAQYYSNYFVGYYFQYVEYLYKGVGLDATAPIAQLVLTSSSKTDEALVADATAYIAELVKDGEDDPNFSYLSHRDTRGNQAEYYRNEANGFEGQIELESYSATSSSAQVGSVSFYLSHETIHNYSGLYQNSESPALASQEIFGESSSNVGFVNSYFGFDDLVLTAYTAAVSSPGANFSVEATDMRAVYYGRTGQDIGQYLALEITDLFASADAIQTTLVSSWGWTFVPANPEDDGSYDHFTRTYGGKSVEAVIQSFTAAVEDNPETTDTDESAPSNAVILMYLPD